MQELIVPVGTIFAVWSNCNSEFTLYRNGTEIENYSAQNLAVGVYNFTVIRTDQISYGDIYDEKTFVVWGPSPRYFIGGINSRLKLGENSRFRIFG